MSDLGQSARASRFVFDRVFNERPFNGDVTPPTLGTLASPEDTAPQFTSSDVETARQLALEEGLRQGREEGRIEGAQAALSAAETMTNAAFAALAEQLTALAQRQDETFDALAQDCERLMHVILDRLLPELVRRGGADEILGVVRAALTIACNDPVVEVRVPHDVVESLRPRIARLSRDVPFRGKVELLGDSYLTDAMVRVRWLHGGAQRDAAQMLTEVSAIVARVLEREGNSNTASSAEAAAPANTTATEN